MLHNKRIVVEISKADELIMTIDENMLSCEFGALDRGNITDVADWGIYVNRGSLTFIDNTGFFNNSTVNSPEIVGYIVKFYLAYRDQENLIATFKVQSVSDFNEETKEVKLECVSKLEEWQRKELNEDYPFDEKSISDLCNTYGLDIGNDRIVIDNAKIYCPYFPKESKWARFEKLCQASMSRVVEDEQGNPSITGSFPAKKPIVVNPSNIVNIATQEFVRIKNSQISAVVRNVEREQTSDETTTSFSIDWNATSPSKSVSFGVPLTFNPLIINNIFYFTDVYGAITFNCGKKIHKVYNAICRSNTKTVNLGNKTTTYGETDKQLVSNSSVSFTSSSIRCPISFTGATYDYHEGALLFYQWESIINSEIKIPVDASYDDGDVTYYGKTDGNSDTTMIPSNDLIQSASTYLTDTGTMSLGQYIVDEVDKRYNNGIECFEIECLFNEYVNESGEVVFDGKDLSQHFKRYDVIIPYVMKKGQKVPLRKNADGTPKKFRIIGISYSYDGLLRQRLSVQEERYDID